MVKTTLYQHRGQMTPIEIRVRPNGDFVDIDLTQTHGKVEISSNDAEWLAELENAIREAREGLANPTTEPCHCGGFTANCPVCDGTGEAPLEGWAA